MFHIAIRLLTDSSNTIEVRPIERLNGNWQTFQGILKAHGGRNAKLPSGAWQSIAPLTRAADLVSALEKAGLSVSLENEVRAHLEQASRKLEALVTEVADEITEAEERSGMTLYPFQRRGVEWLRSRDRALLGDEMGLGKTPQALLAHPQGHPMLVICPAALKGNWALEADRWRPDLAVTILEGRGHFRWPRAGELVIVNYDLLPPEECLSDPADLCGHFVNYTTVIVDEAHAVKSYSAKRTKRVRAIVKLATSCGGRGWLLTGTPLLNRPDELWTVLGGAGLAEDAFGGWTTFTGCFSAYRDRYKAWHWGRPDGSVEERLRSVMLRRRRAEVLPDLPTKTYRTLSTSPLSKSANRELDSIYSQIEEAGLWVDPKALPTFEGFSKARALLAASKCETLLELVEEYEEQEEALVVFSAHRAPIDLLAGREGWAVITGDTPNAERTAIVERFQVGELKGLAGTIGAMGVGLTLTRASHVVFVDQAWTPALNEQAEDRLCRIGQTRGVQVTVLVAPHVLDRHVASLLGAKVETIDLTVNKASGERTVDLAEVASRPASKAPRRATQRENARHTMGNVLELWIAESLERLCEMDLDHAREKNGIGFSKFDGPFGHSMKAQVRAGLTDRQWAACLKLLRKYRRQVGDEPTCSKREQFRVGDCE